jgi:formate C-acetyltransferase
MRRVFEVFSRAVAGRSGPWGGTRHIDMPSSTNHIYFGQVTGTMPDGRKAGTPLYKGIAPVQGAGGKGPMAVICSATKMDHAKTGGPSSM